MFVDSFNCSVSQQLAGILSACLVIGSNLDGGIAFLEGIGGSNYLLVQGVVKLSLDPIDIGKDIFITFDVFNSHCPA